MEQNNYDMTGVYNRGVAIELGIVAAVAYGQLCYWDKNMKSKRFYKTYVEMSKETSLTKYQLHSAYEKLVKHGYIKMEIHRANNSPTCHFKVLKRVEKHSKETPLCNTKHSKETPLSQLRNSTIYESKETPLTQTEEYQKTTTVTGDVVDDDDFWGNGSHPFKEDDNTAKANEISASHCLGEVDMSGDIKSSFIKREIRDSAIKPVNLSEHGDLTKEQKDYEIEKQCIQELAAILGDKSPNVKLELLNSILQTTSKEDLIKGAQYFAKQFTHDVTSDYWRKAPWMKRVSKFLDDTKNGGKRYEDMILAAEAVVKQPFKMF